MQVLGSLASPEVRLARHWRVTLEARLRYDEERKVEYWVVEGESIAFGRSGAIIRSFKHRLVGADLDAVMQEMGEVLKWDRQRAREEH